MPGYCREQTAGWCRKKLGVWLCVGVKIIPCEGYGYCWKQASSAIWEELGAWFCVGVGLCEGYAWILLETNFKWYRGGVRGGVQCRPDIGVRDVVVCRLCLTLGRCYMRSYVEIEQGNESNKRDMST